MSDEREPEIISVERFRQKSLTDAGFPEEEAWLLARRHDVDVHRACDLIAQGCPYNVALKILL